MADKITEFSEILSERLSEIKALRELLAESGESDIHEELIRTADRMYLRLSESQEQLLKSKKSET